MNVAVRAGAPLRVSVVGGSLGGLFAALALQRAGCDVNVYERSANSLADRGAGLRVQPDMVARLQSAGISIEKSAISSRCFRFIGPGNDVIFEVATDITYTSWNRLYQLLLRAIGPGRYHLGMLAEGLRQKSEGVVLQFAGREPVESDLVVAADGLTSTLRQHLAPAEIPRYAGYVCWRGTVPRSSLSPSTQTLLDDAGIYVMPAVGHMSIYPIPGRDACGADCDYNMVWYRPVPAQQLRALMIDGSGHQRQWSVPAGAVKPEDITEMHEAARRELPRCAMEVAMAIARPFIQVIVDVAVERMVHGRACLLADAAFGGRPHLGAGTAKAAADAWTLADALTVRGDSIDAALMKWDARQTALGRRYVEVNRTLGDGLVRNEISPRQFTSRASWEKILLANAG